VKVKGLPGKISAIAAAQLGDYSLALTPDGSVWAWGRNDEGQLGIGSVGKQGCKCSRPVRLGTLSNIKAIAASGGAGAVLKSDRTVWAWGNNQFGQLGRGKLGGTNPTPGQVMGLSGVRALAGGGGFLLALRSDRTVMSWGINTFGELGIGTTSDNPVPHKVGVTATTASAGTSDHGSRIGPISTTTLLLILLASAVPIAAIVASRRRRPPPGPVPFPTPGYAAGYVPGQGAPASAFPGAAAPQPGLARPPGAGVAELEGAWREYGRRVLFLSRVDLFANATRDALAQVAMKLKLRTVPAGGIVCREGEIGDQSFLVEAGTLAVVAELDGRPRELALVGPGEFFGETALLGGGRRSATIRATTDAQLWALSASDFEDLLAREPEVAKAVRRAAAHRTAPGRTGFFEIERRNLAPAQDGQELRLGRSPDNDVVFGSRLVSGHHALITPIDGAFRLRDLDSTNGTYVNGVQIRTAELNDGDEIWVADERFVFDSRAIHRSIEPHGIRLDATALSKEVSGGKRLLQDVTFSILPGEFVAIVGGSGAGKTTLMDALSGVRPPTSGQVLYNGRDYYRDLALFRNVLGYVPQDDIIHTGLPLRVTLRHAAKLRLPADASPADLNEVVEKALAQLELTAQADVKVAQLSGGQRKRASIGGELSTEPRIFFLDEPTSGLDPFTDAQMMELLRRLADDGSTVVLTTHATKNVMLCDKVVFLARGGHLAFVGRPQRALWYFEAESFDTIYKRLAEEGTPEEWGQRFASSDDFRQVLGDQLWAAESAVTAEARTSLGESRGPGGLTRQLRQLAVLTRRSFDLLVHNPSDLPSLVMPPILFSVLALALFHSGAFRPNASSVAPLQILFLIAFSAFIFGLLFGVQEIVKEFAIFRRERLVNLGIVPYVLSKIAILAPLLTLLLLVMVGILRLTSRLPSGGFDLYGPLLLTLVLTGFVGLALALFTSALVSTPQQATDMLSVWIMPQVLFGGALLAVPAMNVIGRVISTIAPVRWSFEALGNIADLTTHFQTDTTQIGPGLAIEYAGSFDRHPAQNWIILALFIVVPLALTCLVLRRKTTAR